MKTLRDIDLTQASALREKIIFLNEELEAEKKKLTDLLVTLNLEYYGTSPSNYYNSIMKEYDTEDGFYVKIASGEIIISKKLKENLTVTFFARFDDFTEFSAYRCEFIYASGRRVNEHCKKLEIMNKYCNISKRFEEILMSEKVYNPFTDFGEYYSFVDFQK